MPQLINTAEATGTFDEVPVDASTELSVEISALSITKAADKAIWVKDELEYTIVVTNIDDRDPDDPLDPGLPVIGVVVTDTIDTSIASLIEPSITLTIDGTVVTPVDYDYDSATGLLTVRLGDLEVASEATITFRVAKV